MASDGPSDVSNKMMNGEPCQAEQKLATLAALFVR